MTRLGRAVTIFKISYNASVILCADRCFISSRTYKVGARGGCNYTVKAKDCKAHQRVCWHTRL